MIRKTVILTIGKNKYKATKIIQNPIKVKFNRNKKIKVKSKEYKGGMANAALIQLSNFDIFSKAMKQYEKNRTDRMKKNLSKLNKETIQNIADSVCSDEPGFEGKETYPPCGKCSVCICRKIMIEKDGVVE